MHSPGQETLRSASLITRLRNEKKKKSFATLEDVRWLINAL